MSGIFDFLPDVGVDMPSQEEVLSTAVNIILPEECEAHNYREIPQDASYEVPPHETSGALTFFGETNGATGAVGGSIAFACCLAVLLALWTGLELALRRGRCHPDTMTDTVSFVLFSLLAFASGAVVIAAAIRLNESARSIAGGLRVIQGTAGAAATLLTDALDSVEQTILSLARVVVDGNVGCLPLTDRIVDAVVDLVGGYIAPYFNEWSSLPGDILGPLEEDLGAAAADIERYGTILQWVLICLSLTGLIGTSVIVVWRASCHWKEKSCHSIKSMPGWVVTCVTMFVIVLMSLAFGFGVAGLLSASEFCLDPSGQLENMAMAKAKESASAYPAPNSTKRDTLRYYSSCEVPSNAEVSGLQLPVILFQASCYSTYIQEYDPDDVPTLCESERVNDGFGLEKSKLAALMDEVVNTTSCAAVNSAYQNIINEACSDAVQWAFAAAWSSAFLALFAAVAVALGRRRARTLETLECTIQSSVEDSDTSPAVGGAQNSRSQRPDSNVGCGRIFNITSNAISV